MRTQVERRDMARERRVRVMRVASSWSPLNDELAAIFGPVTEPTIRRHIAESRARAEADGMLTPAEREAMRSRGL